MTDYVDVLTAGGWVTVDVTASEDNGMLGSSGRHTLIVGSALVYSYYRKR
jgi:hypothetical protein